MVLPFEQDKFAPSPVMIKDILPLPLFYKAARVNSTIWFTFTVVP